MNFVAVKMLTGDRSKYVGLIFAISVASMLMAHQASIFGNIMWRTTSQIQDVRDAEIWVMDPRLRFVDEIEPLSDNNLYRVRGVEGVEWAVRLQDFLTVLDTQRALSQTSVSAADMRTASVAHSP